MAYGRYKKRYGNNKRYYKKKAKMTDFQRYQAIVRNPLPHGVLFRKFTLLNFLATDTSGKGAASLDLVNALSGDDDFIAMMKCYKKFRIYGLKLSTVIKTAAQVTSPCEPLFIGYLPQLTTPSLSGVFSQSIAHLDQHQMIPTTSLGKTQKYYKIRRVDGQPEMHSTDNNVYYTYGFLWFLCSNFASASIALAHFECSLYCVLSDPN